MGDVIAALTADHVERLTGLSAGQLRKWDRTGFFPPAYSLTQISFKNAENPKVGIRGSMAKANEPRPDRTSHRRRAEYARRRRIGDPDDARRAI